MKYYTNGSKLYSSLTKWQEITNCSGQSSSTIRSTTLLSELWKTIKMSKRPYKNVRMQWSEPDMGTHRQEANKKRKQTPLCKIIKALWWRDSRNSRTLGHNTAKWDGRWNETIITKSASSCVKKSRLIMVVKHSNLTNLLYMKIYSKAFGTIVYVHG